MQAEDYSPAWIIQVGCRVLKSDPNRKQAIAMAKGCEGHRVLASGCRLAPIAQMSRLASSTPFNEKKDPHDSARPDSSRWNSMKSNETIDWCPDVELRVHSCDCLSRA